ncbi:MAG: IS110 family transposase, partial [Alphaproteobacteria bacterium]
PLKAFYCRLRDAGKPAKVAIVATMRKLIVALNAMVAAGENWRDPETQQAA